MAYNTNTDGCAKVAPKSQKRVGNIFLKSLQECNNIDTANEILLSAYMLRLQNLEELLDLFYQKFTSTLDYNI